MRTISKSRVGRCAVVALVLGVGGRAAATGDAQTRAVGPQYARSGLHTAWFGKGYRDLWATPVELEVLDLAREAGGLTPVRQVGGMQTPGLAFRGADGRSYGRHQDPGGGGRRRSARRFDLAVLRSGCNIARL